MLVANTRLLWPVFRAARAADPMLAAATDPIDRYTETTIARAAAPLDGRVLYAHQRYGDSFLPFQRVAVAAGLAALAPTQLLVHETYGPWFGLRAIIMHAEPPVAPGIPMPIPRAASRACNCESGCLQAFERAQQAEGPDAWRAWLAARDACTVGRSYRYSDAQLAYHYTKDPRFLETPE